MRANAQTNAFDWRGPSETGQTLSERAYTQKSLARTRKVGHMSQPVGDVFSQPITTRAMSDKTNSIKGKL
jgi:hypothetical protein